MLPGRRLGNDEYRFRPTKLSTRNARQKLPDRRMRAAMFRSKEKKTADEVLRKGLTLLWRVLEHAFDSWDGKSDLAGHVRRVLDANAKTIGVAAVSAGAGAGTLTSIALWKGSLGFWGTVGATLGFVSMPTWVPIAGALTGGAAVTGLIVYATSAKRRRKLAPPPLGHLSPRPRGRKRRKQTASFSSSPSSSSPQEPAHRRAPAAAQEALTEATIALVAEPNAPALKTLVQPIIDLDPDASARERRRAALQNGVSMSAAVASAVALGMGRVEALAFIGKAHASARTIIEANGQASPKQIDELYDRTRQLAIALGVGEDLDGIVKPVGAQAAEIAKRVRKARAS